ncbi:MAG: OmpA family protein [Desulfovibrionaceae bacterium]
MMKCLSKFHILVLALVCVAMGAMTVSAEPIGRPNYAPLIKKVDSFSFLMDISGSMMMQDAVMDSKKIVLAKQVVNGINARLPQLDYNAGLYTLAPAKTLISQGPWNRPAYGAAVRKVPAKLGVYGRMSDLGGGLATLQSSFAAGGSEAIILVTDGWDNIGPDTVAQVQSLMASKPQATIAVISFADSSQGKRSVNRIGALNNHVVVADGYELLTDPDAMDAFIKTVFYTDGTATVVDCVLFATGSDKLDGAARSTLDKLAAIINNVPRGVRSVEIEGFTDSVGNFDSNQRLSDRRVASVKKYLLDRGVAAEKIYTQGNSVSYKYNNSNNDGRLHNRRADLIIN